MRNTMEWHWGMGVALWFLSSVSVAAQELTGTVQWTQRVELGTPQSGVIVSVRVKAGDRVKKGDLLVQLEPRALLARVKKAESEQLKQKKARDEAQRELDRSKELYDRTLLSNHDLEEAKIAFADANSRYQAASAALVEARLNLEQSAIHAPFDGVILMCNAEVGQTVVSALQSIPLVTLAATRQMRVQTEVTSAQLGKLVVGQGVTVESGGHSMKGTISFIGLEPLPRSGEPHYPLQVLFTPEGNLIRVGQPARVTVP